MNNLLFKYIEANQCAFKIEKPGEESPIRIVSGPSIRYGSPATKDSQGDFFTKDTEFSLVLPASTGVFIDHGFNKNFNATKITNAEHYFGEDSISEGIFHKAILDTTYPSHLAVFKEIEDGKMGTSSGAVKHLVRYTPVFYEENKLAFKIDVWPLGELSYSTRPSDKRNWLEIGDSAGKMENFAFSELDCLFTNVGLKDTYEALKTAKEISEDTKIEALKMAGIFLVNQGIKNVEDSKNSSKTELNNEAVLATLQDVDKIIRGK